MIFPHQPMSQPFFRFRQFVIHHDSSSLPVGGIREKILAAKRAGITDIILCEDNEKDITEIPAAYLQGLQFHYVQTVTDVWNIALLPELVDNPIVFHLEEKTEDKKEA